MGIATLVENLPSEPYPNSTLPSGGGLMIKKIDDMGGSCYVFGCRYSEITIDQPTR